MFQAIILGIVQGLAEFLPISSSGHLIVTSWLLGWRDQGLAFDVALHWGTLVAVIVYFHRDLFSLLAHGLRSLHPRTRDFAQVPMQRLAWYVIIATIPAAIAGYFLEDLVSTALRHPLLVAGTLVAAGIMLWCADYFGKKIHPLHKLTWPKALFIGLMQALSVVPGVSRSGSTMIAGLFAGLNRPDAARFSFLISAPIILGAGVKELPEIFKQPDISAVIIGFIVAVIAGLGAIHFLMKYVEKKSFAIFAIYRFVLAAIIIAVYIARN